MWTLACKIAESEILASKDPNDRSHIFSTVLTIFFSLRLETYLVREALASL